jgi:Zn finger protein HypA/HybF involved in hydrogenase expression
MTGGQWHMPAVKHICPFRRAAIPTNRLGTTDVPMERVCPKCQHTETETTLRTTWQLYVRCPRCGHVWAISQTPRRPSER